MKDVEIKQSKSEMNQTGTTIHNGIDLKKKENLSDSN